MPLSTHPSDQAPPSSEGREVIATILIDAHGGAVVIGGHLAADRAAIEKGIAHALEFMREID